MSHMKRNQNSRRDSSPLPWRTSIGDKPDRRHRVKCEIIQSLLLDYLNRELDPVRSDMVWKHLKKCAECEREANEMEATLEVLRRASRVPGNAPEHLSEKHRASIVRALTHPVLHWMEKYHVVASLVVAVLIIAGIVIYLRWVEKHEEPFERPTELIEIDLHPHSLPPPATNESGRTGDGQDKGKD